MVGTVDPPPGFQPVRFKYDQLAHEDFMESLGQAVQRIPDLPGNDLVSELVLGICGRVLLALPSVHT